MKKWYINKKYNLQVQAESKQEAISEMAMMIDDFAIEKLSKITAMSSKSLKEMKKTLEDNTKNIISWWCLSWYLSNVQNKNNLLNHEKGKLADLLWDLRDDTFDGKDRPDTKRKILEQLWLGSDNYSTNTAKIVKMFKNKFSKEKIKEDNKLYSKIAGEFQKDIEVIIDMICDRKEAEIRKYVLERFPE